MINFKITTLADGNLSIEGTTGKSVQLSPGEMIKAEVLDVISPESVSLRIKGEVITAKTAVPLQQGETAFFKVSDSPASANELKLRFVGYEETSQDAAPLKNFMSSSEGQTLAGLIQELSDSLLSYSQASAPGNRSPASSMAGYTANSAQSNTEGTVSPDSVETLMEGDGFPERGGSTDVQGMSASTLKDQENSVYVTKDSVAYAKSGQSDTFSLAKVESLLKALPADINALPKEVKTQLQDLLFASLKTTGQSIQSRLATVSGQISEVMNNSASAEQFKADLMLSMDSLRAAPLKNALLNTGVAFEAKLKSAVVQMQFDALPAGAEIDEETIGLAGSHDFSGNMVQINVAEIADSKAQTEVSGEAKPPAAQSQLQPSDAPVRTHDALPALRNDLKAVLLELKQRLPVLAQSSPAARDSKAPAYATETANMAVLKNLQGRVESLLKDIETFQALSKTTDSFYTFLPVDWKALKDGEVSFKRGRSRSGGGNSSSCRINLDLDKSGTLSILVLMHNKDFFISFKADRPDTDLLIGSNLEELKSSFREIGLSLKAAHMLDKADTSMEQIEGLGSSETTISIKA